jgi:hypothetical protein
MRKKHTAIDLMAVLLVITTIPALVPFIHAEMYGYEAIKPSGSFTELTSVSGQMYTYLNSITTNNRHIDRLVYMTNINDFTMGVGYYDSKSGGTEIYKWLRYQDNGSINNNNHWLASTGPSSEAWTSVEVSETSANVFNFKVNGGSLGTITCNPNCPNLLIAGAAAWGNGASSSEMNVNTGFQSLQFKRNTDSSAQNWAGNYAIWKCANYPDNANSVGIDFVSGINAFWVDSSVADECEYTDGTEIAGYLYNSDAGG